MLCDDRHVDVGLHYDGELCLVSALVHSRATGAKHLHSESMSEISFKQKAVPGSPHHEQCESV